MCGSTLGPEGAVREVTQIQLQCVTGNNQRITRDVHGPIEIDRDAEEKMSLRTFNPPFLVGGERGWGGRILKKGKGGKKGMSWVGRETYCRSSRYELVLVYKI